jgi:urease accessory protein
MTTMAARPIKPSLAAAAVLLTPAVAFAHTGAGHASGFLHGFGHPISSLDHVLAMVMVGVFAFQLGGRALWLVPSTFVAVMAAGGALGITSSGVPFVEAGIALSVVGLGAAVALGVKAPVAAAMGVVGLFALFHGHAHGAEMPDGASGVAYGAGFMLATALLHLAGIGGGFLVGKAGERHASLVVRSAGSLAGLAGVGLLTGIL